MELFIFLRGGYREKKNYTVDFILQSYIHVHM